MLSIHAVDLAHHPSPSLPADPPGGPQALAPAAMAPHSHVERCEAGGDARVAACHQVLALTRHLLRRLHGNVRKAAC